MAGEQELNATHLMCPRIQNCSILFVTQGGKEEMVTEMIEEPVLLSKSVQFFLGIASLG